jgi:homoserine O-acetyltransferase/O-succinyltransferase
VSARELRIHRTARFAVDGGQTLRNVRQAYHLDGTLNAEGDNLVLVFHALTGDADAVGGWWSQVAGEGRAIDTGRYAVLSPNLLGSCYGTEAGNGRPLPPLGPRDMARLAGLLVHELGVRSIALVAGGSLGGMVALEFIAQHPGLARSAAVFAAPAAQTALATGWGHVQRQALELGGPERGLALARMAAMLTYRTGEELEGRFGRRRRPDGTPQVHAYLDHHGDKLVRRFTAESYRTLIDAMDRHDVGRGRGGVARALDGAVQHLYAIGIPGDLLYPADEVRRWADEAGTAFREIRSIRGHDAFLIEHEQVAALLAEALLATSPAGAHAEVGP